MEISILFNGLKYNPVNFAVLRGKHLLEFLAAAFLIAYLILQLLVGKPLYFMELVMGQFSAKGPTKVWEMNPAAKGIGISMCMISLIVAIYYNIIMAYTLYFFFSSMQTTLPWTECKPVSMMSLMERSL